MPDTYANLIKQTVTNAPGTLGDLTLGPAVSGWLALTADATVNVTIYASDSDTAAKEVRTGCTYTHGTTTLTRGTLESGSAIDLTSSAIVMVTIPASLITQFDAIASVFGAEVISVTGAVTATIGAMHHCTGTSADYTVTLPAASGNSGKMLGFRMGSAAGLTKLVTLDGNASETIDGATTRVMWAEETAILLCDGSNWFKVAGKSVPMTVRTSRSTDQTGISPGVWTKISLNTKDSGTDHMWDSGNSRIKIARPGVVNVVYGLYFQAASGMSFFYASAALNNATLTSPQQTFQASTPTAAGTDAAAAGAAVFSVAAGDYIQLIGQSNGTTIKAATGGEISLSATEVVTW